MPQLTISRRPVPLIQLKYLIHLNRKAEDPGENCGEHRFNRYRSDDPSNNSRK